MKITLYRYEKGTLVMRSVEMEKLLAALRTENQSKPVSTMRDRVMFALPGTQNSFIQKLPTIVFGGTFRKTGESRPPMRNYTGLILLEVNHLSDTQEAVQIRQQAAGMPQTLLTFIGFSGKSVKIVVPFTLPDGTLPRSLEQIKRFHSQAYLTAVKYYQPQLERNITLKEPVLRYGCRMSYDPQLMYNPDAVAIRIEQPAHMPETGKIRIIPEAPSDPLQRLMPSMTRNYRIATLFSAAMVDAIRKAGRIKDDNLKPFFTQLAQNCLNAGIPEEDAVQCVLLYNDLIPKKTEIRMTFRSVYLLKKALSAQAVLPEIMSLTMQLEEFMLRRYEIRCNKMSGEVEYRDKSLLRFTFSPFTREARNSICTEAHKEGLNVWDKDIERYVYSDNTPAFFPIEEYLGHVPEWDGADHIRALAKRVPCNNSQWPGQFYRWFLSMVAHWLGLDREHGNSTTPLLVGDQGCGKSTYCLNILPPELRQFYTDSVDFSKRRDTELALHRYALVNIDEFDSIKETQQSYLKHVLQMANVNTRLPYQTANRNLRRYATFIATSNNFDILTDPTGSRRFICIEVTGTIDYIQPIDYEQLYAQAMEALANDERYWFTHEEEAEIVANNRQFQQIPAEEQLFLQYFRIPKEEETGEFLLATEILERIKHKKRDFNYTKTIIANFGRLLKRNNIPSKRSRKGTIYQVVETNKP
ncbi:BT4734/BF3469 family protein [Parabacteroides sp. ASD2025]|uniref:BT4734/BF3469 family protein n=1 Tax=Parabacteroides sp. ASD2025 TaxID=3415987 RepID=UPI003CF50F84